MVIKLYFSTVSSNLEIKKHQQKIVMVLDGKHIGYEVIDISSSDDDKQEMRDKSGDPSCLPPQLFNDDEYLGDYEAFDRAVEEEELEKFLKM